MKKLLTFLAVMLIGFTSCQKDSELKQTEQTNQIKRDGTQAGSLNAERINTLQNPLQLAILMIEYNQFEKITVKVTKWDYQNGHTPMVITGTQTYHVTDLAVNQGYLNRQYTGFTYDGAMQVDIYRDTTGVLSYSRYVLLTDSLGWTVNLDTTSAPLTGWVGQNKIYDVVPKSYQ